MIQIQPWPQMSSHSRPEVVNHKTKNVAGVQGHIFIHFRSPHYMASCYGDHRCGPYVGLMCIIKVVVRAFYY